MTKDIVCKSKSYQTSQNIKNTKLYKMNNTNPTLTRGELGCYGWARITYIKTCRIW